MLSSHEWIQRKNRDSIRDATTQLAIDLIRVCDLSSEVLAITEASWPIEKSFRNTHSAFALLRLGHSLEASTTSSRQITTNNL